MSGPSQNEFGKRRPAGLPDIAPPKRSRHVALLVMGTLAVGGGAYAAMPRENCQPPQPASPGMAAPALPQPNAQATAQANANCGSHGSWGHGGGSYGRWSRLNFFGGNSAPAGDSASGHVTRAGFGSFAHAFGFPGRS